MDKDEDDQEVYIPFWKPTITKEGLNLSKKSYNWKQVQKGTKRLMEKQDREAQKKYEIRRAAYLKQEEEKWAPVDKKDVRR